MSYTIDIDTGGTFTDGFFVEGSRVRTVKVPTTPHDLTLCFLECITAGARQLEVSVEDMLVNTEVIRFSTTIGTNTLIERNGTKVGLLVSHGEEGTLQVTGEEGDEPPLVHPEMVRTLKGSVAEDGRVIEAVDRDEALQAAQQLLDDGARCLVVSLKNSAYNATQEQQVRTWIKEEYPRDYLGSVPVFLSSDITNLPGNRERTNAAVLNAYIHARLVKFLYKAGEDLRKRFYNRPLLIVHATGGVARVAKTKAINTYNSGPAAGLMGAAALSRLYGIKDLVSGDMGGTSFDMGLVRNGQPNFTLRPEVEGLPLATPMVAIRAIGAGGGSIAAVRRGKLQVGPQSAGALPGPACFDLGGTNATVTDADVVLGYIDPAYYLGGAMKLDRKKAAEAIEARVGSALGLDLISAAMAIRDGVDMSMGTELKAVVDSTSKDFNPVLAIYGGAGSAHCCGLAERRRDQEDHCTPVCLSFFGQCPFRYGRLAYLFATSRCMAEARGTYDGERVCHHRCHSRNVCGGGEGHAGRRIRRNAGLLPGGVFPESGRRCARGACCAGGVRLERPAGGRAGEAKRRVGSGPPALLTGCLPPRYGPDTPLRNHEPGAPGAIPRGRIQGQSAGVLERRGGDGGDASV